MTADHSSLRSYVRDIADNQNPLATGGTAAATAKLVEALGGVVAGLSFLIEIDELGGRARLGDRSAKALLHY